MDDNVIHNARVAATVARSKPSHLRTPEDHMALQAERDIIAGQKFATELKKSPKTVIVVAGHPRR